MDRRKVKVNHIANEVECHQRRDDCPRKRSHSCLEKVQKSCNTKVLNIGSDTSAPGSNRSEDKPISLEVVAAAPGMSVEV